MTAERKRKPRSIALTDEEWQEIVRASQAEPVRPGAAAHDRTPAAWARRVLLREAERVRREGA